MTKVNPEIAKQRMAPLIIALEMRKGHLRWSISELAKHAKVSRSLVYYYFGKTKSEILLGALTELVEEFYGLSASRQDLSLHESLLRSHALYKKNPQYAAFFQRWRHTSTEMAKVFIKVEKAYEARLRAVFTQATDAHIRALHGIFHGLTTAPYLDRESIAAALGLLKLETLRP